MVRGKSIVIGHIKKGSGFTLIELMLASALLMTIMFAGYYGYSLYSQKWQKRVDVYWTSTKQGIGLDALSKLFMSVNNYVVKNEQGRESIYFEASPSKIRFISSSPILSEGTAIVELEVQEISDGYKQLVYKEASVDEQPIYRLAQIENLRNWQYQVVLLDELKHMEWSFYGWTSFQDALTQAEITESAGKQELRKTYQIHRFNEIRVLPNSVNFRIDDENHSSNFTIDLPNHTVFKVISNIRSDA